MLPDIGLVSCQKINGNWSHIGFSDMSKNRDFFHEVPYFQRKEQAGFWHSLGAYVENGIGKEVRTIYKGFAGLSGIAFGLNYPVNNVQRSH